MRHNKYVLDYLTTAESSCPVINWAWRIAEHTLNADSKWTDRSSRYISIQSHQQAFETDSPYSSSEIIFYLTEHGELGELATARSFPFACARLTKTFVFSALCASLRVWADRLICKTIGENNDRLYFPRSEISNVPFGSEVLWATWHSQSRNLQTHIALPAWFASSWDSLCDIRKQIVCESFTATVSFAIHHEIAHHTCGHFPRPKEFAKRRADEMEADSEAIKRILIRLSLAPKEHRRQLLIAYFLGILTALLLFHLMQVLQCPRKSDLDTDSEYPSIATRTKNLIDIVLHATVLGDFQFSDFFASLETLRDLSGIHPAFKYAIGSIWSPHSREY
jgi:hypothetical protein